MNTRNARVFLADLCARAAGNVRQADRDARAVARLPGRFAPSAEGAAIRVDVLAAVVAAVADDANAAEAADWPDGVWRDVLRHASAASLGAARGAGAAAEYLMLAIYAPDMPDGAVRRCVEAAAETHATFERAEQRVAARTYGLGDLGEEVLG